MSGGKVITYSGDDVIKMPGESEAGYRERFAQNREKLAETAGFTLTREQLIEGAARTAHEVNRAYCNSIGDRTQVRWENAEEWQRESARAGVVAVSNGLGPRELHESWCRHKAADGWRWGELKDAFAKTHPCMLPYDQLPQAQQVKDHLFYAVVSNYLASTSGAKSLG